MSFIKKNVAFGVAGLDTNSKILMAQIPDGIAGGLTWKGTWNATTNSPALADGVGTNGDTYRVATAGSTSLDGETDWEVGDWVMFNNTVWEKMDHTDATHTGDVTGDVALTIAADAVTYDKMQNVVADNVFLGNNSGAGSIVDELTVAEVKTMLGVTASVATAKVANYTAVAGDFILMTAGGTDKTVTLPVAASNTNAVIEIKLVDSGVGNCIIDGDTAETIDGATTITLTSQYESVSLHCDGTTWWIK